MPVLEKVGAMASRTFLSEHWRFVTGVCVFALLSVIVFVYTMKIEFRVCVLTESKDFERFKLSISALDAIVDLSIKLSTVLVGAGTALLIGLKSGLSLAPFGRFCLLVATICFAQSMLYAVLWRMGVAELWLNQCLDLISTPC